MFGQGYLSMSALLEYDLNVMMNMYVFGWIMMYDDDHFLKVLMQ